MQRLVRDLNHLLPRARRRCGSSTPSPAGFRWLVVDDRDANVVAFARFSAQGTAAGGGREPLAGAAPGLPRCRCPTPGRWREVLNTDAEVYGGANLGNLGGVHAEDTPVGRRVGLGRGDAAPARE